MDRIAFETGLLTNDRPALILTFRHAFENRKNGLMAPIGIAILGMTFSGIQALLNHK